MIKFILGLIFIASIASFALGSMGSSDRCSREIVACANSAEKQDGWGWKFLKGAECSLKNAYCLTKELIND